MVQYETNVPSSGAGERLRMSGIRKRFGATQALDGVDLTVLPGEVHALVGENGAGKSTLMKTLSGAILPDAGQMLLDGKPYTPSEPLHARRLGVSMIYQELALAPHLSVMENILLGMEPTAGPLMKWTEVRQRAASALSELGRPDISPAALVSSLPIADRQIVEIARAVAVGCRVLVLDEPTSSLTQRDVERLFDMIRRLSAGGVSIIYISHFLEEVKAVSQRFTVLRDGRTVGGGVTAAEPIPKIIGMMVGRDMSELYPRSARQPGDTVLEISSLAGSKKPANASLQLRRGEVLGIAGLVGAGRTEMLRAIFGLDSVRSGSIRIAQYEGVADPAQRWRQGLGMVSEDRKNEGLAVSLSIADNLTLSRQPAFLSPSKLGAEASRWIAKLKVKCASSTQPIASLSGGNQQKVAIARLLHHDVDVFLLDEPTRGIDVGSKAQIYQLIDELACRGKAVLMVSSYLPELLGVCDRIAVMCRGVLMPARPVSEIDEHQIMIEATGATEADGSQPAEVA